MLEIVKKKKVIKIDEVVYEMKSPTYKDSLKYQEMISKAGENPTDQAEALFDYLQELGMSKDVSKDLDTNDVIDIIKYLSGEKKTV